MEKKVFEKTEFGGRTGSYRFRRQEPRQGKRVKDKADYEAHLNRSLDDVIDLLQREIERLKESLQTYRLSSHPNRQEMIRWHVRTLDERQDALEKLQEMILAEKHPDRLH